MFIYGLRFPSSSFFFTEALWVLASQATTDSFLFVDHGCVIVVVNNVILVFSLSKEDSKRFILKPNTLSVTDVH